VIPLLRWCSASKSPRLLLTAGRVYYAGPRARSTALAWRASKSSPAGQPQVLLLNGSFLAGARQPPGQGRSPHLNEDSRRFGSAAGRGALDAPKTLSLEKPGSSAEPGCRCRVEQRTPGHARLISRGVSADRARPSGRRSSRRSPDTGSALYVFTPFLDSTSNPQIQGGPTSITDVCMVVRAAGSALSAGHPIRRAPPKIGPHSRSARGAAGTGILGVHIRSPYSRAHRSPGFDRCGPGSLRGALARRPDGSV
jgi:hypothetical protein